MKKDSLNKKTARATIIVNTRLSVIIPVGIIILVLEYIFDVKNPIIVLSVLAISILFSGFVASIIIKKGGTKAIIERWKEEDQKSRFEKRSLENQKLENFKKAYRVVEASFTYLKSGYLNITFNQKVHKDAKPEVKIGNSNVKLQNFDGYVGSFLVKEIANEIDLFLDVNGQITKIQNPYAMRSMYAPNMIRWQTKGHIEECHIYIDSEMLVNPSRDVWYQFDIIINRKNYGTFTGVYEKENSFVKIVIGHAVHDAHCTENKCILAPVWNSDIRITLPKPEVLSVNNKMVVGDLFPRQQTG